METSFYIKLIASELKVLERYVSQTAQLFEEGATIPFISRYRKELTGGMDEVQIQWIKSQLDKYADLEERRKTILESIEKQGKLSPELKQKIEACLLLSELEDLYLPYKQKRKTRAIMAIEKGLEPLAKMIMAQSDMDPLKAASRFLNEQVKDVDEALQGARDIIAEWVNEDLFARQRVRNLFAREAVIISKVVKGKDEEAQKYRDYFAWEEPLKRCPSHRLLAMRRGEEEGLLRVSIDIPDEEEAITAVSKIFVKFRNPASEQVAIAVKDSYKRLLAPSIETEFAAQSKEKADLEAIKVFAENLKQLLLASPLGPKRTLALDPGFRTGCKVVVINEQGDLLHYEAIFPHPPQGEYSKSAAKVSQLVQAYKIEAIAIGNGTASRETESFIKSVRFDREVKVYMVNESGASIYSASAVAREEFPDYDVTVRGAVSIGRRLMDPLAELVKIDPKSIGVGQYQHDVNQPLLKESLDQVVISCVNRVGVDLNTASPHLLTYVSGLGPQLAKKIVEFRNEKGPFQSRNELKKVPRLGDKAFEQSAGFLRIRNSENPLDNTAVHPESYPIVEKMAKDMQVSVAELIKNQELQKKIEVKNYVTEKTGLPTLTDIMQELAKPGRDPRSDIKMFEFAQGIYRMQDLKPGMVIPGIVTNITNFGAFVDIGVHQDGLIHISQFKEGYVSNPAEVVRLNQHVMVKVLSVEIERKRIQLSMKDVNKS